jgi:hypothetical protein
MKPRFTFDQAAELFEQTLAQANEDCKKTSDLLKKHEFQEFLKSIEPEKNDKPLVKVTRKCIELYGIRGGKNAYYIEKERMDTPAKFLGWLFHLGGKGGFTGDHLKELIKAAEKTGIVIDYHA